jgi:lactate permease
MNLLSWVSIAPFVIFLYLLLFKKVTLLKSSLVTLALVLAINVDVWRVVPIVITGSFIKGAFIALDIFLIILGAVFFLEILRKTGVIENICYFLEGFSKDYRVQVIFIAWFFENLIEGTAGFGTPTVIAAPLLIGMGIPPIRAVAISLLGNSTSVAFGAAGTPIRVGFAGLEALNIPLYTALINSIGIIVPVFMLFFAVQGRKEKVKEFFEALPFAIWSGVVFTVPSILSVSLGQEFPSIVGSIVGMILIIITTKLGIFTPKNTIDPHPTEKPKEILSKFKVLFPYTFLTILLFAGKFILGKYNLNIELVIKHSINLFNPGIAFIIASVPTIIIFRRKDLIFPTAKSSLKRTIEPFLVILAMSAMVQLMISSGNNTSGIPSSLNLIAGGLKTRMLPLIAPFIGAFGSFITGSATVSNIMFGSFLNVVAKGLYMNAGIILSLELVGAAAGNMIALADILAAETVVGLRGKEREVLKEVVIPCLIYITLVGIIGLLII